MYSVINAFVDLQDENYLYSVGDSFPREGAVVKIERIRELMGDKNNLGVPLIKLEGEISTKEELIKTPFFKLKSLAVKNGINTKDKKAEELREELAEKLGL